ncbi:MAG TPA: hypothetical protein VFQ41_26135, partial [Candidatus Angelobacter sp.]|nr:hypothetical protein [Candidatus Angelobacter sp.]
GGPRQKTWLVIQRRPALGASEGKCKEQRKTYSELTVHFPSFLGFLEMVPLLFPQAALLSQKDARMLRLAGEN